MKSLLMVMAVVLITAGLLVAVLSVVEPGQVIFGIDMRLAGTLVVGGVVLLGLASIMGLLERIGRELRQLRELGTELPWLRESAAMSPAQPAAPAMGETARHAVEESQQPPIAAEAQWQPHSRPVEPPPPAPEPAAPEPAPQSIPEPAFEPRSEIEPDRAPEPEPEREPELEVERELEPQLHTVAEPEAPEPELPEPELPEPELPEPELPEPELPEPELREPQRAQLRPSDGAAEEPAALSEPAQAPAPQEGTGGEPAELYVVEERMFRGRQSRVLSDGTIEAETDEGWMRFEDFDHLEEYLDATAASRQV
jgi:hypothetical protein